MNDTALFKRWYCEVDSRLHGNDKLIAGIVVRDSLRLMEKEEQNREALRQAPDTTGGTTGGGTTGQERNRPSIGSGGPVLHWR